MKLDSNVSEAQIEEIIALVPDAFDSPDEAWRTVPHTKAGLTYSISSVRNIVIKHTTIDALGRTIKPRLLTMQLDGTVYDTSIVRESSNYSTYLEHIRNDAFPEFTSSSSISAERECIPYDGLDWYGHLISEVYMLPVSEIDMGYVRRIYPDDLPRELWAYVPETGNKYVVSSQGRGVILPHYRATGARIGVTKWQLESNTHGKYYECCLSVDGYQLNSVSHPHILRSFIPKPSDEYEVNHIDGDTHNNMIDNLEWVTRKQNSEHYNQAPQMELRRQEGFRKISEFGKAHQKEIQNRPEVNAKRSKSVKASWTDERRARQSAQAKLNWESRRKAADESCKD